jgi:hypothetical protein
MAQINNSQLSKEMIEGAKINISFDNIPTQIADKVIPTMEVNPKMLRICNIVKDGSATNATSATIYTTPTDKDFYLVSAQMSVIKDVTATSTNSFVNAVIDGLTSTMMRIRGLTLTPQSETISISLNPPLKIDRGTNITIGNTTNVANVSASGSIVGYTTEQG